ncbi:hypothetical protein [Citricoccus nitrophenolicus]|uniref:hypothetical protein n=1 Tax=Citricoccus nitrophenolicus TaxID=863575 RepID=UPI00361D0D58
MNEQDNDLYWVILGGPIFFLGAFAGIGTWLAGGLTNATLWLVEHNVLAAADEATVTIGAGGLDTARIVLLAAVLVLIVVGSVAAMRARSRRAA